MDEDHDRRPSPDALLDLAQKEKRGRLKIFLGASPGVGKTYAMLQGARRLKEEGRDVVIGLVETHGRSDTAALLSGLEVLPRKEHLYRGHVLREFDLDAALARRPELIVVDELPHSNPPDARHPKRYLDIEELIEAGIDVWTALNIQHIESLSDVVSTITGVKVREVVPDTVVEEADDVVLVDITPGELIQRLKQGKVYLPDNARRAADNFLQPGNLTALRELALRRTAQRVDDQMVDYLRQKAIEGPWPSAERLLVCVGSDAMAEQVVRAGARLASGLNATWHAVHVSGPGGAADLSRSKAVDEALSLAERLGAEVSRLTATDLAAEVMKLARRENITQIVVGRADPPLLKRLTRGSFPDELLRLAKGIAVHVISLDVAPQHGDWTLPRINRPGILASFIAVALATLTGYGLGQLVSLPNLSMIFLTGVLFCAVIYGTSSAVSAAVLSFLAYNFFFIEPRFTLTVARPHELFALVMFLLVAVLTGSLAGRLREQSLATLARVKQIQSLLDFSRKLSGTVQKDDALWVVATQTSATVQGDSMILLKEGDNLQIAAAMPPEDSLAPADQAAARWAVEHGEPSGRRTGTLPNAGFLFLPITTPRGVIGTLGIKPKGDVFPEETRRMIDALIDQTSLALERIRLIAEASEARAMAEGEKLRSALLSSVSHDLRTPLAAIVGSVTALRDLGSRMTESQRDDLLLNIEEEASRLARFVTNLLDMTRLEAGGVALNLVRVDLGELAGAVVRRAREELPGRMINTQIPGEPVLAEADPALLEQLLFNLVENAHKYTAPAGLITVRVLAQRGRVLMEVEDEGPGIPAAEHAKIFEKFHRVRADDGRPPGTGLGLAICKAIADALKGTITVMSPVKNGHGSRFRVELPGTSP